MMGVYQDLTSPKTCLDSCHECGETFKKSETYKSGAKVKLEIYDDPFATEPRIVAVHGLNGDDYETCLDKLTDTAWADFRYFTCDCCGRLVARQCGYNGWRSYVKNTDNGEICVSCYHKDRLENGEPEDAFDNGHIPGDFYSEADLEEKGWTPSEGPMNYHVRGSEDADRVCAAAKNLFAQGLKVLVDYDSMAYGGGEGYVSLYTKEGL